jgi:hypothetical protein
MKLGFGRRNEVGSRFRGNRQTDTHTDRQNDYRVPLRRMRRGLITYTTLQTSLADQPLHKSEEGSGIMPIRELFLASSPGAPIFSKLFQCLAVTQRVQNHTRT